MSKNKNLEQLFKSNKFDVPDGGFTKHTIKRLPKRNSVLPLIIIAFCAALGMLLTIAIQGINPFFEEIDYFITSINNSQIPPLSSIMTYLGGLGILGAIGFAMAQADY